MARLFSLHPTEPATEAQRAVNGIGTFAREHLEL
jgi:hypothetical protein